MAQNTRPWFSFYTQDFTESGTVKVMTNAEVGAYVKLLCYQWSEGHIPDDEADCARIVGEVPSTFRRMWKRIEKCFPLKGRVRVNPRLEQEYLKAIAISSVRSSAAQEGVKKRTAQAVARGATKARTTTRARGGSNAPVSANDPMPIGDVLRVWAEKGGAE